ncbi:MAG: protoporphyrinogen oxidase [Ornithinimicrobium sp.]
MGHTYLVIGGGISGLSAAWAVLQADPTADVTVLESSPVLGGKIASGQVAGVALDTGAESLLARRPEGLQLLDELDLSGEVVHPQTSQAALWSRGMLHPLPGGTVMGIPGDPSSLFPLLSASEISRALDERTGDPAPGQDVSVGDFVAARLGDAVVDRMIEPLLGGVYAGHAREISLAAALPTMLPAYQDGSSLLTAVRAALPAPVPTGAVRPPVFAGLEGGVHRLIAALAEALRDHGSQIHLGVTAREVRRRPVESGGGFDVVTGPQPAPSVWHADRVILATPPAPSARLLRGVVPRAADVLAGIEMASMAIVTMALPADRAPTLVGSGVLVPPTEGLRVKASTFSGNKWDWVRRRGETNDERTVFVRASIGRHREEVDLQRSDDELVEAVRDDLARLVGQSVPVPLDAHVQRWGGALPQYAVGHLERVAVLQREVSAVPGLAVCGAAYNGVGIPACIASGRSAAAQVCPAQWPHDHP